MYACTSLTTWVINWIDELEWILIFFLALPLFPLLNLEKNMHLCAHVLLKNIFLVASLLRIKTRMSVSKSIIIHNESWFGVLLEHSHKKSYASCFSVSKCFLVENNFFLVTI